MADNIPVQNQQDVPLTSNPPPMVASGIACLVCLPVIWLVTSPLVNFLHSRWAGRLHWVLITIVPISVAFVFLYRSSWHPEFSKARRIVATGLSSCFIFGVDLVILALATMMALMILALVRVVGGN